MYTPTAKQSEGKVGKASDLCLFVEFSRRSHCCAQNYSKTLWIDVTANERQHLGQKSSFLRYPVSRILVVTRVPTGDSNLSP